MKKQILLFAFTSLLSVTVFSQTNQGSKFLGGSVSATISNNSNYYAMADGSSSSSSTQRYRISPSAGYFIADNFALGLSAGYTYSSYLSEYLYPSNNNYARFESNFSNSISLIPYARYYFNLTEKIAVFTQLNIGYAYDFGSGHTISQSSGNSNRNDYITKGSTFNTSLVPGINYFLNEKFALEATVGSLGYSKSKLISTPESGSGNTQTSNNSNLGLNFSMSSINIGFRYFIPAKS